MREVGYSWDTQMLPQGGGVSNHPLEDFQKYRSWALTLGDSE